MGAILHLADVIEVKVGCYAFGQAGINRVRWLVSNIVGGPTTTDDVAIAMDTVLAPAYKPLMHAAASYYGVSAQTIFPGPLPAASISHAHVGVGTGGMDAMPCQVSGVITLQSALAGRKGRGRIYPPFPAEDFDDPLTESPTPAYVVALNTLGAIISASIIVINGANTATLTPVVFNKALNTTKVIVAFRSNQKWGSQRRRGNYGAKNPYPPF